MDHIPDQLSDHLKQGSCTASASDGSSVSHSDEEVVPILASNRPKKRAGRRVFKETRHPVFRGVRRRNGDKWVCEVREPNKKSRIWLGTYPTVEMAARAHDVAALALRGKSACLNFADSAWRLPVPTSMDAKEIRRAAAEAAELFRPEEGGDNSNIREENSGLVDSNEGCSDQEYCKSIIFQENVRENVSFMDEEEVFDMPRLLVEMAEGLLLSPPRFEGDAGTNALDMSLWSY